MAEVIQSELSSGTTLCGGKYVIEKKIGAGGFGITYIARHTTLERKYAIKEFFMSGYNVRNNVTNHVSLQGLDLSDFDKVRQNFINEARTLAQLNNEAIVKVIDIFDENGTAYMVMPFVEGVTLQSMVEKDGPMKYEMAVNYMVQICEALTYIHSKNILHRDVTPDNVIVTPEQKIVLIDFGSARKFIEGKTQRQTTIVKPGYAPLEQHSARSRKGAFTDIYSVGAVFYYLLTGETPMDATERVLEKMQEPIELNPEVPPQINAIIMKAMEMDGEMRYQSAKELIDDIFSDDPVGYKETEEEVAGIKEEDIQPKEEVKEESNAETKQETKATEQDLQGRKDSNKPIGIKANKVEKKPKDKKDAKTPKDTKDGNDIRETPQAEEGKVNEDTNEVKEKGKSGKSLKVVAVVLALLAVAAVVVVIVFQPFDLSFLKGTPSEQNVQNPELAELETTPVPTLDSLMQQMMQLDNKTILNGLLTNNSKDPVALFAIAMEAKEDVRDPLMEIFWKQVLVPEGDVDRHLTASREKFSRPKFAFVCGARAYESIPGSDYHPSVKQELKDSLTSFLDELRQIDTTVLVYEKIQ